MGLVHRPQSALCPPRLQALRQIHGAPLRTTLLPLAEACVSSPQHESGESGYIVNTASIYGLASATSAYGITKQSVVAISEAFQSSLAAQGSAVQVASLCPSFHSTNIGAAEYEKQQIPTGTPEQQARKQWMDVGTQGALPLSQGGAEGALLACAGHPEQRAGASQRCTLRL